MSVQIYIPCVRADFMWIPMQGIKFREFMAVVCTLNWNGSPASAKLNKGKSSFALALVLVSNWE